MDEDISVDDATTTEDELDGADTVSDVLEDETARTAELDAAVEETTSGVSVGVGVMICTELEWLSENEAAWVEELGTADEEAASGVGVAT